MRQKKGMLVLPILLVIIGVITTTRTLSRPEMATVRAVDVVSLTGAGFCWGTAFGLLMTIAQRGRFGPSQSDFRR